MVKRIKKRIPREDGEIVEVEVEEAEDAPTGAPTVEELGIDPNARRESDVPDNDKLGEVPEDRFTVLTARVVTWVLAKRLVILGALVLVFAGLMVANFVLKNLQKKRETAASVFFEAHAAQRESRDVRPPLLMLGQDADDKKELTAEERKARLEKARDTYQSVRTEHAGQPLGRTASLGLAATQLELGKTEDALKLYDELLADPALDPLSRALALQAKAVGLESLGKASDAIATWKLVEQANPKTYGLLAGINVGRLLEQDGKTAEAKTHLEKVKLDQAKALEFMGSAPFKRELEARLARLSQGT